MDVLPSWEELGNWCDELGNPPDVTALLWTFLGTVRDGWYSAAHTQTQPVSDRANLPCCTGKDDEERLTCSGGIRLASANGKIVCSNTLDDRLRIAFAANMPQFRAALFGAPEY